MPVVDTIQEATIASIGQGACGKIYEKMIREHLSNFYVLQTHNTFYDKIMFYNHYLKTKINKYFQSTIISHFLQRRSFHIKNNLPLNNLFLIDKSS